MTNGPNTPFWLRFGAMVGRCLRPFRRRAGWLILKPGSLGDALLFAGALRALRQQIPDSKIVLATDRRAFDILGRLPYVDQFLVLDESLGKHGFRNRLARLHFAIRLFCQPYNCIVYPFYGDPSKWSNPVYSLLSGCEKYHFSVQFAETSNLGVHCRAIEVPHNMHEIDKMATIIRAIGCEQVRSRSDIWPELVLHKEERAFAQEIVARSAGEGVSVNGCRLSGGEARSSHQAAFAAPASRGSPEQRATKNECLNRETRETRENGHGAPGAWGSEQGAGKLGKRTSNIEHRTSNVQPITKNEERRTKHPRDVTDNHAQRTLRVAVCAGARFKCKAWPEERYAELLARLASTEFLAPRGYDRVAFYLLGEAGDWESNERIVALSVNGCQFSGNEVGLDIGTKNQEPITDNRFQARNLAGTTSIHQAAAVIEACDLCIGNDTFGLHAAIAVGTPSVVIMWSGCGDQWIPWGDPNRHRMVRIDVACKHCIGNCVKRSFECMERITVEMVVEEIGLLPQISPE